MDVSISGYFVMHVLINGQKCPLINIPVIDIDLDFFRNQLWLTTFS